jgi:hypothetical protein
MCLVSLSPGQLSWLKETGFFPKWETQSLLHVLDSTLVIRLKVYLEKGIKFTEAGFSLYGTTVSGGQGA